MPDDEYKKIGDSFKAYLKDIAIEFVNKFPIIIC